jgi:Deoxyxylulose-5-phosphate synthase
MLTSIPNTVIYSPSCYEELRLCLKKAIYANKGLVAVRYPRGAEKVDFNRNYISTEHLLIHNEKSDTLIITYGRIYNEAYKAQSLLEADGINCDILKLTQIYPIAQELIKEIKEYKRIVFFEEAQKNGGVSSVVGDMLVWKGYSGDYTRVAIDGFVKQASVSSALRKYGLTCDKMADYIRRRSMNDGKA